MINSVQMDYYGRGYDGRKNNYTKESWKLIDELFDMLNQIKPCGEDNLHILWFALDYSPEIDDDGTEYIDKYAEPKVWYKLSTINYINTNREVKAIYINNNAILEYISDVPNNSFELDITELMECLIEQVKLAIEMMKKDEYNSYIAQNLSYLKRYGTIARKDYYKVFEGAKEEYLEELSDDEIKEFERLVTSQVDEKEMQNGLETMTANAFYNACYLGYVENNYENVEVYSPKEAYYRYADGRDEGLRDIDENSIEEFSNWYFDRERYGGHPWEVCRGGNSTHIDLGITNRQGKWYYFLRGKSWGRCIEVIKFYIALNRKGLPVYLDNALEILKRVLGEDKIGIVPDYIIPRYCESAFPSEKILDFIHLPYDENKEKMIKYVDWQEIDEQYLK